MFYFLISILFLSCATFLNAADSFFFSPKSFIRLDEKTLLDSKKKIGVESELNHFLKSLEEKTFNAKINLNCAKIFADQLDIQPKFQFELNETLMKSLDDKLKKNLLHYLIVPQIVAQYLNGRLSKLFKKNAPQYKKLFEIKFDPNLINDGFDYLLVGTIEHLKIQLNPYPKKITSLFSTLDKFLTQMVIDSFNPQSLITQSYKTIKENKEVELTHQIKLEFTTPLNLISNLSLQNSYHSLFFNENTLLNSLERDLRLVLSQKTEYEVFKNSILDPIQRARLRELYPFSLRPDYFYVLGNLEIKEETKKKFPYDIRELPKESPWLPCLETLAITGFAPILGDSQ